MVDAVPSAWNLANLLTVLRIALVPFFAWALVADGGHTTTGRLIATALFVVAAATDRLDGWLARRSGQVTDLGKMLDPIADKVLIGTALVLLSWLGDLPWWVTVIILVRELGITVYRFIALKNRVIAASKSGKIKTLVQAVAISLFLLPIWTWVGDWFLWVNWVVMAAALVLTVYSGVSFLIKAARAQRS